MQGPEAIYVTHYCRDHNHTTRRDLRPASTQTYGAVVGIDTQAGKPIMGPAGDHLQFSIVVSPSQKYQVDVNTQSANGTAILVYVADETLSADSPTSPFGPPMCGVFTAPEAKLSYKEIGLEDKLFAPLNHARIESQLDAALQQAELVVAYGQIFDDGGSNGKGIHDTHRNPSRPEQDGAVVVYLSRPNQPPIRRWFFFMFQGESVG